MKIQNCTNWKPT